MYIDIYMVFKKIIMLHSIIVPHYLTLYSALYFSMYLNILFYYYVLLPLILTIVTCMYYYCILPEFNKLLSIVYCINFGAIHKTY